MTARNPPLPDPTIQRLAAEMAHMATKQSDYSSVLQAVQIDLRHIVKTMDMLTEVAKEQVALGAKMSQHGDAIDRAFRTMDGHKGELAAALNKLSETLDRDRDSASKIAETVNGYKAQLRLLYTIGTIVVALVVALASMTSANIAKDVADNRAIIDQSTNDIEVMEAKWERLRIGDQLIVSEHERRLSRLEVKGDEVAP